MRLYTGHRFVLGTYWTIVLSLSIALTSYRAFRSSHKCTKCHFLICSDFRRIQLADGVSYVVWLPLPPSKGGTPYALVSQQGEIVSGVLQARFTTSGLSCPRRWRREQSYLCPKCEATSLTPFTYIDSCGPKASGCRRNCTYIYSTKRDSGTELI